jgi:hypothetical protein
MNAGNITIFEKTAKAFLDQSLPSVDASHAEVTSFKVVGQTLVGSGRRLQQANIGLEVSYQTQAILFPGHSRSYNFNDEVATTFQSQATTFQQSLSEASPFFPPPQSTDSLNGGQSTANDGSRHRTTIYVVVVGVVVIAFFIVFACKSFRDRDQQKRNRTLADKLPVEKVMSQNELPQGSLIDGSLITESSSGRFAQGSNPDNLRNRPPSEENLLVFNMSSEMESCPMCLDIPVFEKKRQSYIQ